MNPLATLVEAIRADDPNRQIPDFDPAGGGVGSEILFLLEAPGPMAVAGKGSGIISPDNNDGSAKRFKAQLQVAGLDRKRMIIWTIVPWYLGDGKSIDSASGKNIADARRYLDQLVELLPHLKFVVLVGGKARSALGYLSRHHRFHNCPARPSLSYRKNFRQVEHQTHARAFEIESFAKGVRAFTPTLILPVRYAIHRRSLRRDVSRERMHVLSALERARVRAMFLTQEASNLAQRLEVALLQPNGDFLFE